MSGLGDYAAVVILVVTVMAIAAVIMALTYLVGPKRRGNVKQSVYESGVNPVGDARRRFNVRFYLVAVLFLIFDVEVVFLYPWAVIFPRLRAVEGTDGPRLAALAEQGFTPAFFAVGIGVFFLLLTVGFLYEWRKGVFRWD